MPDPVVTSVLDLGMISHKPTRDALRQAAAGAKSGPVWILNRNGDRIGAIVSVPDAAFAERARKDAAKLARRPASMLQPVTFSDDDEEAGRVAFRPVDEAEDAG